MRTRILQWWEPREGTSFAWSFQMKKSSHLTSSSPLMSKGFKEFKIHGFSLSFEVSYLNEWVKYAMKDLCCKYTCMWKLWSLGKGLVLQVTEYVLVETVKNNGEIVRDYPPLLLSEFSFNTCASLKSFFGFLYSFQCLRNWWLMISHCPYTGRFTLLSLHVILRRWHSWWKEENIEGTKW